MLPRVEAVLDARRVPFRVVRTKSLEHGVAKALQAIEAGELPVVISGDGMIGAIGGAMAGGETPLGIVPGGRGNDLARVLGIPTEPEEAIEVVLAGHSRPIDVGEANGKPLPRHRQRRLRLRRQPDRQRDAACAATSSTPTRRCARWPAGSRPASRSRSATCAPGSRATR